MASSGDLRAVLRIKQMAAEAGRDPTGPGLPSVNYEAAAACVRLREEARLLNERAGWSAEEFDRDVPYLEVSDLPAPGTPEFDAAERPTRSSASPGRAPASSSASSRPGRKDTSKPSRSRRASRRWLRRRRPNGAAADASGSGPTSRSGTRDVSVPGAKRASRRPIRRPRGRSRRRGAPRPMPDRGRSRRGRSGDSREARRPRRPPPSGVARRRP
jgi:hypothetical protein